MLILASAWCFAGISIQTRKMQAINFATVQLYYGFFAFPATALIIGTIALIKNERLTFLTYDGK